jgi:hypothetical protein
VDSVDGAVATDHAQPVAPTVVEGIRDLARAPQRLFDPARELPRLDVGLLGLRVDRDDAPGAVADEIDDGVRYRLSADGLATPG